MDLANQDSGANNIGIFSDLPSETAEAVEAQPSETVANAGEQSVSEGRKQETPQGDTDADSRVRSLKLDDGRVVEIQVLSDDIDPDLVPNGMMMDANYRKKTMAHADTVKAFESQKADFDTKMTELEELLSFDVKQLESDEMKELKEVDPDSYWDKVNSVKDKHEKLKSYREQRNEELTEQLQGEVKSEQAKYTDLIPEWLDDSRMQQEVPMIAEFLRGEGYSDQEIAGVYKAHHIATVRKAALYDKIQSQSLEKNKVSKAAKSSKPSSSAEGGGGEKSLEEIFYG